MNVFKVAVWKLWASLVKTAETDFKLGGFFIIILIFLIGRVF